jgi:uncharacterized low-complexity protein
MPGWYAAPDAGGRSSWVTGNANATITVGVHFLSSDGYSARLAALDALTLSRIEIMSARRLSLAAATLSLLMAATACRSAQSSPTTDATPAGGSGVGPAAGAGSAGTAQGGQQDSTAAQGRQGGPGQAGGDPQPRPYNRVITPQAKTRTGLFKTHQLGSRLYFEIPRTALGKEILLVTRASRVPVNMGYGGQAGGAASRAALGAP